jgi:FMN phosphatase YigB (HAD superfamily)
MKAILFDLGDTLEHQDQLLPGAVETLAAIRVLQDASGVAPALALVSDFDFPPPAPPLAAIQQEYYQILDGLGIRHFFEPVADHVTLSPEVGVGKPAPAIFRAALDKLSPGLPFAEALFVTERLDHVQAARALGMAAVHFKGPGQTSGDIDTLLDLVPLVQRFLTGGHTP